MFQDCDMFIEEEKKIKSIIEKYNKRKRKTMVASPYALFFLDVGPDILIKMKEETGNIPTPEDGIKRINYEWRRLCQYDRLFYLYASKKLGYKPEATNAKEMIRNISRQTRTNRFIEFIKLFTF